MPLGVNSRRDQTWGDLLGDDGMHIGEIRGRRSTGAEQLCSDGGGQQVQRSDVRMGERGRDRDARDEGERRDRAEEMWLLLVMLGRSDVGSLISSIHVFWCPFWDRSGE